MRTGVSYLGHYNPKYMQMDLKEIKALGCDDVFLAAQENDFVYMRGKVDFFPKIAKDNGLTAWAIFWGALNYFGGGKSSQFLLENPRAHQVLKDGAYNPGGCYNNPDCIAYIKEMIDRISEAGFDGYFIDEPSITPCYCPSCLELYESMHGGNLLEVDSEKEQFFRKKCVVRYVCLLSDYIKIRHPQMRTMCCIMPQDKILWGDIARIDSLDNLGTDIYWVNEDIDVEQMSGLIKEMSSLCAKNNKKHHQWLQCWGVKKGKEQRIIDSGNAFLRENPDALYVWAYNGQLGTSEACEDPNAAWKAACEILRKAKK
ncbi:MAG: hypothetical protein L6416_10655 [Candidatus Omnitrophica bacterium]|nr:hypothetical protein [Candidatus Omnitrophota bacterium]